MDGIFFDKKSLSRYNIRMTKKIKNAIVRKKLKFGIEFELFTLDEKGYMTDGADRLIKRVRDNHSDIEIKRECGKNMIEIITPPHTDVPDAMLKILEDFEKVAICAQKEKIILYAYGTYPGAFTPEFHANKRYTALQKIFGKQRFLISGRCIGLHIHYSLPWGVFDYIEKIIKPLVISKNKQSMVNIYNLCIAMDPALTVFSQSSPFYQGKKLGKDSRVIAYRGGKELDNPHGQFANYPQFGALPGYMSTNTDLLYMIKDRFVEWAELLKNIGRDALMLTKHGSILDNTWNPIKVNAHGTIEIRGMDMNHPDIVTAIAIIIKFIIKAIQENYLEVVPSDIGVEEPFKKEENKIYIPPDSYVRSQLQKMAAYEGLENDVIHKYCSSLLKLAEKFIPPERVLQLKPIEDMLESRETASDRIVKKVREMGIDVDGEITAAQAAGLALLLSEDLYTEIIFTKNNLMDHVRENS